MLTVLISNINLTGLRDSWRGLDHDCYLFQRINPLMVGSGCAGRVGPWGLPLVGDSLAGAPPQALFPAHREVNILHHCACYLWSWYFGASYGLKVWARLKISSLNCEHWVFSLSNSKICQCNNHFICKSLSFSLKKLFMNARYRVDSHTVFSLYSQAKFWDKSNIITALLWWVRYHFLLSKCSKWKLLR